MNKKHIYITCMLLAGLSCLYACKKSKAGSDENPNPVVANGTRDELTKDSIFLYSKELYYWYNSLPGYDTFKPRNFSSNETELYALTQYSNNPQTGKPYEYVANSTRPKYSFIDYLDNSGKASSLRADLNGTNNDYGFSVNYYTADDLRVTYVYPGSPADQQGLTRGCKVTSVNGRTNISYNSTNVNYLNSAIFGTAASISLTFTDLNGTSKNVVVTRNSYKVNPILYKGVYTAGTKKVGYLVFNSFTEDATADLVSAFSNFAAQGVSEMIVDLRYNGGGYISTASELINLMAPAAQTGNTMFTYYYSDYLTNLTTAQRRASVLKNQPLLDENGKLQLFSNTINGKYVSYADVDYSPTSAENIEKFAKAGSLNISRVYFIVSGLTASASELTINCLRPVMDVKLIGQTTYGKPVGFFPIRIDKLDLYVPEFETKNQVGAGGYYAGMTVDKESGEDNRKAWGDDSETLLAYALQYAKTGSFNAPQAKVATTANSISATNGLSLADIRQSANSIDAGNFRGMVRSTIKRH